MLTSDYHVIEKCRGCHRSAENFQEVLKMDSMPLAGMFCETREEALRAPIFPLTWMHCSGCGLVQVREDISDASLFSKYNYASSTVPGLTRHFVSYAAFLQGRYAGNASVTLLEIGCNDGVLLNKLPRDWRLIGWDPSDVAVRAVEPNGNYQLFPKPFNFLNAEESGLENSVDVISGSNCLAHVSDPKDVFEAAWHVLRPGGHFWLEVHDLDALLQGAQWDTIYHEHKVEWSEASLIRCLGSIGFEHRETFRTPMHGGALRIGFAKGQRSTPGRELAVMEPGLRELPGAYASRLKTPAALELRRLLREGLRIAAYGASGRANVYLNQLPELTFDYIVDEAPLRMNKFIPRVGTPIVPPSWLEEKPASSCLVTAWNYRDDIVRKNPQHQGSWLTAFQENR
jgi:SAM-dependent methyltransferase